MFLQKETCMPLVGAHREGVVPWRVNAFLLLCFYVLLSTGVYPTLRITVVEKSGWCDPFQKKGVSQMYSSVVSQLRPGHVCATTTATRSFPPEKCGP